MDLTRSHRLLVVSLVFVVLAVVLIPVCLASGRLVGLVILVLGLLLFAALAISELRPFRFHISAAGLDLRTAGIKRLVPWSEVDALVLHQPPREPGRNVTPAPRLLLVPVAGAGLDERLDVRNPADQRPARVLLGLDDVRQPADDVAAALARFAGDRFTDLRTHSEPLPDFTIVLRGYDPAATDDLIARMTAEINAPTRLDRIPAITELSRTTLPVELRGYDRGQVDAYLEQLMKRLV